jgi:hypothetical protein
MPFLPGLDTRTQKGTPMINETKDLRASLRQMSEGFRAIGAQPGAWLMPEFVLREGIDCKAQALPPRYKRRVPKRCFANTAQMLKRARGLTYVEGFVSSPRVPFPVHHAWAINADNEVIDTTLGEPELCAYVGVKFSPAEYAAGTRCETRAWKSASIMLDWVGCVRTEYLLTRCPGLRDLMPMDRAA